MRLAMSLVAALALSVAAYGQLSEGALDQRVHDVARRAITFDDVPTRSIALGQWPSRASGPYALRVVLFETPEGIASSLTLEPEGDRFESQVLKTSPIRVNHWAFRPSECPAMAALYAEFPSLAQLPEVEPFDPPCGNSPGAASELRVANGEKVERFRPPDKYGPWLGRLWSEIDACRRDRAPAVLIWPEASP